MKKLVRYIGCWLNDLELGWMFFKTLRNIRKQYPDKNFLARLSFACASMQWATTKSQIEMAIRHGGRSSEKIDDPV